MNVAPPGLLAGLLRLALAALLAAISAAQAGAGELVLVTGRQPAAVTLAPRDVADILLGHKRSWPDGRRIKVALLKSDPQQEALFNTCLGRTTRQYWSHWRDLVFAGRGQMPKVFATEGEILAYVAAEEGAVGLVDTRCITAGSGVHAVTVEGAPTP